MMYGCGFKQSADDPIGCTFVTHSPGLVRRHLWEVHGQDLHADRLDRIEAKLDKLIASQSSEQPPA